MKLARAAFAASFALSLAGCLGETTTLSVYYERTGVPSLFRYAASGRDFRTVIYGNPTTASQDAIDAAVIAAMQGRNWGPETNFTTTPSDDARGEYRVVMIFSRHCPLPLGHMPTVDVRREHERGRVFAVEMPDCRLDAGEFARRALTYARYA